jgi:hypothetical protein
MSQAVSTEGPSLQKLTRVQVTWRITLVLIYIHIPDEVQTYTYMMIQTTMYIPVCVLQSTCPIQEIFYLLLGIRLAVESITSDELRVIHHPDAIILLLWILTSQTCEREDWTHLIIRQLLDQMDLFSYFRKTSRKFLLLGLDWMLKSCCGIWGLL